jgi:hypothetical protein
MPGMRLGIAHHYGWAVAVTATADHRVVDRRRIEMVAPGLPAAPIHHVGDLHDMHRRSDRLDEDRLAGLVARVRASAVKTTWVSLDALPAGIVSISLRAWPPDFPTDIAVLRRPPYESRADSVMYLQVLAELAADRGWRVHLYDAKQVERQAAAMLGARAKEVLHDPRTVLGPPWTKDHRTALAATVVLGRD